MRAVLDTNVLVSGLINEERTCGRILRMAVNGYVVIYVDDRILDEYQAVLLRPHFKIPPERMSKALVMIQTRAVRVAPPPLRAELPDRSDLPFLETAASANAVLVTGNARHFPARERAGVVVMAPAEFLAFLHPET